jgi:hypothetical protein
MVLLPSFQHATGIGSGNLLYRLYVYKLSDENTCVCRGLYVDYRLFRLVCNLSPREIVKSCSLALVMPSCVLCANCDYMLQHLQSHRSTSPAPIPRLN